LAARRSASAAQTTGRRDQILAYLAQRGGRIESANGVGLTAAIADAVGYDDIGVLNGMLARLEQQGAIRREIRGRRTFAIELGKGTNRRKSPSSAPAPARRNGRSSTASITQFAEAATELVDQMASLRGTIDELASRVAALENGGSGSAPASAPTRRSSKRGASKRGASKRGASKRTTAKRGAAKKTTAKRATAKRATAKRGAAKKTTAKRATAKKTTARRATAKRGPAKKAAAKRAPARGRGRGASLDDRAAVRAWARSNGYAINDRGRLPREVVDAYRTAR
jgi:hypothetical protein